MVRPSDSVAMAQSHALAQEFEEIALSLITDGYQGYAGAPAKHELSEKRICQVGNFLGVKLINEKWLNPYKGWKEERWLKSTS